IRFRFVQCSAQDGLDRSEMSARGELGDDAAEDAMHILRQNHERSQVDVVAGAVEQRDRRLVARCLDPENTGHGVVLPARPRRNIAFTCGGRTTTPNPVVSRSTTCGTVSITMLSATV